MEIQQLRYYLDASNTLSFAATAETFHVSRQAISNSVRSLEGELKTQLLDRSHSRMNLTPVGADFAVRAQETLALFDQIENCFSVPAVVSLSLAVDSFLFDPSSAVLESLMQYADMPEGCIIQLAQESFDRIYHRIVNRNCDIGIVRTMKHVLPECDFVTLRTAHLGCLVASNSKLAAQDSLSLQDLRGQMIIAPNGFEKRYAPVIYGAGKSVFDRSHVSLIDEKSVATKAISQGLGVGVTDFTGNTKTETEDGVVKMPLDVPPLLIYDVLFYRKDNPKASQIGHFVHWLVDNKCWSNWNLSHTDSTL